MHGSHAVTSVFDLFPHIVTNGLHYLGLIGFDPVSRFIINWLIIGAGLDLSYLTVYKSYFECVGYEKVSL